MEPQGDAAGHTREGWEDENPHSAEEGEEADEVDPEDGISGSPLAAELEELKDRHIRLVAEFDNFRKRSYNELSEAGIRGQATLVGRLLDVLDDMSRVTGLDPEDASAEAILEGVAMVEKKLHRTLEDAGLERISPEGDPFDPNTMEALLRMPAATSEEDDTVGQLLQVGFRFKGHLIRPARVGVLKFEE